MHRQDELRELEDELGEMDKRDNKNPEREFNLRSREIDAEDDDSRASLLNKIEEKALKYGALPSSFWSLIEYVAKLRQASCYSKHRPL